MTPDLEEMIRQRAHEIWEQEGRPHGRHEEHWQMAAGEITQELERIKAAHTPATAEEIEASPAPRKRRTSNAASMDRAASGGEVGNSGNGQKGAPRNRAQKAVDEAQAEVAPAESTTRRRRVAKGTTGAQSEPAIDGAPKTRSRKSQAAEVSPDASTSERPARRGRKPKADSI